MNVSLKISTVIKMLCIWFGGIEVSVQNAKKLLFNNLDIKLYLQKLHWPLSMLSVNSKLAKRIIGIPQVKAKVFGLVSIAQNSLLNWGE